MKRLLLLFLMISTGIFAQTGIGTTMPNASAKLEVSATKGLLPPRNTLMICASFNNNFISIERLL